ncbi:hypothetical protein [Clostridium celatum]|nr:hypothetical protein [Clostridium celatum]
MTRNIVIYAKSANKMDSGIYIFIDIYYLDECNKIISVDKLINEKMVKVY